MWFARFRRRWDPKGSVINAFATFLLLSYSKLLTVSYSLLDVLVHYATTEVQELVQYYCILILQLSISADNTFHLLSLPYVSCCVCAFPAVTAPPVPHEIIPEMSWLLY